MSSEIVDDKNILMSPEEYVHKKWHVRKVDFIIAKTQIKLVEMQEDWQKF